MIETISDENDREIVTIENDFFSAKISLYGAQILSWIPEGGNDVFYLSSEALYVEGKAIRGGSPLCWPWFGKAGSPAHGWARTAQWTLLSAEECEGELGEHHVELVLEYQPEGGAAVPKARVKYIFEGGESLTMVLQTTAGNKELDMTFAFHNYFALSSLFDTKVYGLEGVEYTDYTLGEPREACSDRILRVSGAVDRVYPYVSKNRLVIKDEGWDREIRIETDEEHSCVVWNPGEEGAAVMADLPDDDWDTFLCIETGKVTPLVQQLAPGASYQYTQTIIIDQ